MPKSYQIDIMNYVLDSVHGPIGLTMVENEIERLPIFKRLQDIAQLGLVKRIFPCAVHSRYVHSLGVMFVADKMALQLHLNDNERQLLRLAALLHDIGHYPLSHDLEATYSDFYSDAHKECQIEEPRAYKVIRSLKKDDEDISIELDGHETKKYHHETIGAIIVRNNSRIKEKIADYFVKDNDWFGELEATDIDLATNDVLDDIACIITGNARHKSRFFSNSYSIMVQLIHSEMDADNIDYLLRDAAFSGTTYGIMDMSLLIDCMTTQTLSFCMQNPMNYQYEDISYTIVGIKPKGIGYVDQFMINRYLAYTQVIYHKYTSILSAMLQCAVMWLLDSGTITDYSDPRDMAEKADSNDLFLTFNDSLIISEIGKVDTDKCPTVVKKCIEYLREYMAFSISDSPNEKENDKTFTAVDANDAYKSIVLSENLYSEIKKLDEEIRDLNRSNIGQRNRKWQLEDRPQELILKSMLLHIDSRQITKQMPKDKYELLLRVNNRTDKEKRDKYDFDRLMNGIPIIIGDAKRPELIIDSPASVLHRISTQKCIRIRKYKV